MTPMCAVFRVMRSSRLFDTHPSPRAAADSKPKSSNRRNDRACALSAYIRIPFRPTFLFPAFHESICRTYWDCHRMSGKSEGARIVGLDGADDGTRVIATARPGGLLPPPEYRDDEPTLGEYIGTIVENRVLVAAGTAATVVLAVLYLFFAAPTSRSYALLQEEDRTKGIAGVDDLANVFSEKS